MTIRKVILGGALLVMMIVEASAQICDIASPQTTDPQINTFTNVHTACLNLTSDIRNQLFVFLPGTGGVPFVYSNIVAHAANLGFHAVGLMYPNDVSVNDRCGGLRLDGDCHEAVRLETFDGTNRTSEVNVNRANSIENRLIKLIQHLANTYPRLQWDQFLDGTGNVVWPKVVIAGHSQGGGYAGIIGKIRPVHRVVMFAAMDWWYRESQPANWVFKTGATPTKAYFGFGHYDDAQVQSNQIVTFWDALDMDLYGPEDLVDDSAKPYRGSHMLMTDVTTANPHSVMIVDQALPSGDAFHDVWTWMLTGPDIVPGHRVTISNSQTYLSWDTSPDTVYQAMISGDGKTYTEVGSAVAGDGNPVSIPVPDQPAALFRIDISY